MISSPRVLRWFSSPSFASAPYVFRCRMTVSLPPGYPIRLSADRRICAPPRSFSQLITAFLASLLQGIHHKPFSRLTILLSTRTLHLSTQYPVKFPYITLHYKTCFRKYLFGVPKRNPKTKPVRVLLPVPLCISKNYVSGVRVPLLEIRGLEPLTSSLQSWRSSQLSYIPVCSELYPNKKVRGRIIKIAFAILI